MMLRDCSRLHGQLTADKLRLTNQVREILWRYYPQFLEIYSDLSRLWVLELWMPGANTPQGEAPATEQH